MSPVCAFAAADKEMVEVSKPKKSKGMTRKAGKKGSNGKLNAPRMFVLAAVEPADKAKRGRGRPKKQAAAEPVGSRKRGRPKKQVDDDEDDEDQDAEPVRKQKKADKAMGSRKVHTAAEPVVNKRKGMTRKYTHHVVSQYHPYFAYATCLYAVKQRRDIESETALSVARKNEGDGQLLRETFKGLMVAQDRELASRDRELVAVKVASHVVLNSVRVAVRAGAPAHEAVAILDSAYATGFLGGKKWWWLLCHVHMPLLKCSDCD